MFIRGKILKYFRDESGNVLILVSIFLVVLLGMTVFAIDVGSVYQTRRQLVNAADAGALAGALELVQQRAKNLDGNSFNANEVYEEAETFALQNVQYGSAKNIEKIDITVFPVDVTSDHVTVEIEMEGDLFFYSAFQSLVSMFSSGTVDPVIPNISAKATAAILPLGGMKGLIPIGIPPEDYSAGQSFELVLKGNNQVFGPGLWGYVDFDLALGLPGPPGGGAKELADFIRNGYYRGMININDSILFESGNKTNSKLVSNAIDYHIINENIVFVPVIEGTSSGVSDPVQVVGFAAVRLTERNPSKGQTIVKGIYLGAATAGDIYKDAPDYGAYGVALID